jgi:hypothetical protein
LLGSSSFFLCFDGSKQVSHVPPCLPPHSRCSCSCRSFRWQFYNFCVVSLRLFCWPRFPLGWSGWAVVEHAQKLHHWRRWCWHCLGLQVLLLLFWCTRLKLDVIECAEIFYPPSTLLGLPWLATIIHLHRAGSDPVDLDIKGADLQPTMPRRPCSTLDLEMELLHLPPAMETYAIFGRPVHASTAPSNHLQPMLCTILRLAVCDFGAPTAVPRRARRHFSCSCFCCSFLVKGPSCNPLLSGGLLCKPACLI